MTRKEFFPLIGEALKLTGEAEKSFNIPKKIREHSFHGTSVEIYRNGMCFWKNIWFRKDGKNIYQLEKSAITSCKRERDGSYRKEYFRTELKRTYEGVQNCFIEFSLYLSKLKSFPEPVDFLTAGELFGLEMAITNMYTDYYNKFFSPK